MKRISLVFMLSLLLSVLFAQRDGLDRNGNVKVDDLFEDLMELNSGGVFRGVSFDQSKAQVLATEEARSTTAVYKDEKPEELVITSDMGDDILNFADITYTFDDKGLYHIKVETFGTTSESTAKVYDMIKAHYTSKFGVGSLQEDGFYEFIAKSRSAEYIIAMENIDSELSPGIYLYIYLK